MRKILVLTLTIIFTLSVVSAAFAGEVEYLKAKQYYSEKKLPYLAYSLGFILPSAGHLYAGDWPRGLNFLWKELICVGLVMIGDSTCKAVGNQSPEYNQGLAEVFVGIIGYFVFHFWQSSDAWWTAEEYNMKLREKYGVSLSLRDNQPVVQYRSWF